MSPASGRILVVDDHPSVRKIIVTMLQAAGYETIEAANGSEAIHLFAEHGREIAAATLDLAMPETNGRETLAMLSEFAPRLPIVISTAYPLPDDLIGRRPGSPGVGYLQKPYTVQDLVAELKRVIAEVSADPAG